MFPWVDHCLQNYCRTKKNMADLLDPEVKHLVKQLHCEFVAWAADIVTILYQREDQKVRLVREMGLLGWFLVTGTEDAHNLEDIATTLDFSRRSQENITLARTPTSTSSPESITLDTSAVAFTQFLLMIFFGVLLAGLLSVRHDPWPKQMVLWGISLGSIALLYLTIVRERYSFQKITFAADQIILAGAGRKRGGEHLPLHDIESWGHKRLQFARGYCHLVTFTMKDGHKYDIKCAAKYGPSIIAEIQKRIH